MNKLKIGLIVILAVTLLWISTKKIDVDDHAIARVTSVTYVPAVSSKRWHDRSRVESVPTGENYYDPISLSWLPINENVLIKDGFWEDLGTGAHYDINLEIHSKIGNGPFTLYCKNSVWCNEKQVTVDDEFYCVVSRKKDLIILVKDMLGYPVQLNVAYTSLQKR